MAVGGLWPSESGLKGLFDSRSILWGMFIASRTLKEVVPLSGASHTQKSILIIFEEERALPHNFG
jgi:hypothetical protein